MKKIIVMAGSNSKSSINRALVRYAYSQLMECEALEIDLSKTILPLYSPDLQKESGFPHEVQEMYQKIESADGILLSLAEYNGSYASPFKNAFDWLSRIDVKVWQNKPMLLMATSPGRRGGAGVLEAAQKDFPHYGGNLVSVFSLPNFQQNFDAEKIKGKELKEELFGKIKKFQTVIGN